MVTAIQADQGAPRVVRDRLQRPLQDLRISLTDRCNFRCRYCMPKEVFGPGFAFVPHADLLTFAEIERLTRLSVELGVRKVHGRVRDPLVVDK